MKKIMILIFTIFTMFILQACQEENQPLVDNGSTKSFEEVEAIISNSLPIYLNRRVILPTFDNVDIIWTLNGEVIEYVLPYQSPAYDQDIIITAEVTINDMTKIYSYTMLLISRESALNQNSMYIYTDIPIEDVDKETYQNAFIQLSSSVNGVDEVVLEHNEVEIRGRGNSTWWFRDKKPYRLRFSEDISILGMPAAKSYILLSEYADKSLLRNTLAFAFSDMLEHIEYTPTTRVVEVYFNDEYFGVYILTEQIELHENKLSINSNPQSVDAGFLIELDQRFFEEGLSIGVDGFTVKDYPYVIKSPKPGDDLRTEQLAFIKQYIIDLEHALATKTNYEQYIDIDNFIDYFIVQELFKNVDVGFGSVYFYKPAGDVLKMGPIWDFDFAFGNADYIDYGIENWYGMRAYKNRWFQLMMSIPEVRARFKTRYIEVYQEKIPELLTILDQHYLAMIPLAERNFQRWDILGQYDWPNPPELVDAGTYQQQVQYVYDYIEDRAYWIYQEVQSTDFQNGMFD